MIKYQVENTFGLSFNDVRRMFPNVSLVSGESNPELNIIAYQTSPQPQHNYLREQVIEVSPRESHGVYTQRWMVIPLEQEEAELRVKQHNESMAIQIESSMYELFNSKAREKGYDSYQNVFIRTGFKSIFQKECLAFAKWVETCETIYFENKDSINSFEELEKLLPELKW